MRWPDMTLVFSTVPDFFVACLLHNWNLSSQDEAMESPQTMIEELMSVELSRESGSRVEFQAKMGEDYYHTKSLRKPVSILQ